MASIVILGAGAMGTAISTPLSDNGHQVQLVGTHLDGDIIQQIRTYGFHPKLPRRVNEGVKPCTYDRLSEVMQGADLVVLGVNSLGINWAAKMLGPWLSPQIPVVLLAKGLAGDGRRIRLLPEMLRSDLPCDYRDEVQLAAIAGPSIAGELAVRHHTSVVIAGSDQPLLDRIAAMLRTPYYHIQTSLDLVGVEICAALKNLYTLAVGMVNGQLQKEGEAEDGVATHNLAATVFTQALTEIAYLVDSMGGQMHSVYTLPGAGDLYVTCQSGRNIRMGNLLGSGMSYSQAKAQHMPEDTVEGAELALAVWPTAKAMIRRGDLDGSALPLLQTVIAVVDSETAVDVPWDKLLSKLPRTAAPFIFR